MYINEFDWKLDLGPSLYLGACDASPDHTLTIMTCGGIEILMTCL